MVKIGDWFSEAWQILMEDIGTWLLIGLLASLIGSFSMCILLPPMSVGVYIAAAARLRGERPRIDHLWQGFQYFGSSWGVFILMVVLFFVGFLACVIPAIYLSVIFLFAWVILVEEGTGGWAALMRSKDIIHRDFWNWLLVALLLGAAYWVASCIPVVGTAAFLSFQTLFLAIAYRDYVAGGAPQQAAYAAPPVTGYGPPPPGGAAPPVYGPPPTAGEAPAPPAPAAPSSVDAGAPPPPPPPPPPPAGV